MKAIGKNVILEEREVETTTAGGIVLQSDITSGFKPGVVVSVGADVENDMIIKGKVVVLNWKSALPFEHQGVKYAAVDESEIKVVM